MSTVLAMAGNAKKVPVRKANPYGKKAMAAHRAAPVVPQRKGGIHERAMLVALTVRRWHIGRNERTLEENVSAAAKADQEMVSVRKKLVRKESISKMRIIEAELRSTHHMLTLPWDDSGYRILSSAGHFKYAEKINALIEQYNAAADQFVFEEYDDLKAEAKKLLGSLYNEADYPSKEKLRSLYQAHIHPRGISPAEDFRVDLGETEANLIRKQIAEEQEAQLHAAYRSVWERLSEVLTHAVERLKAYSVDAEGKVSHPFRESLVTNIRELLDIIPILNVMGDARLTEFAGRVRADIAGYSAEVLRDDASVREKVIDSADDILSKMAEFLA